MDIISITEAEWRILHTEGCPICSEYIESAGDAFWLPGASVFVCDECAIYHFDITPAEYENIRGTQISRNRFFLTI